jgi:putative ABC transport system permease protein
MPDWVQYVRRHLHLPGLNPEREAEIVEDLAHQLEDAYRDALARGDSEQQAAAYARAQIPDWESFAAELRQAERRHRQSHIDKWHDRADQAASQKGGGWTMFTDLRRDLLYGLRMLAKKPGFTAVAILSLGVGIAVITTVFSLTNAFFLRPLPFPDAGQLVHVWQTDPEVGWDTLRVPVPNYEDWREQNTVFEDLGGYFYTSYTLTEGSASQRVLATRLTPNLFGVLGVEPILGRLFTEEEGQPGRGDVVVLAYPFWQRHFAGSADVLGEKLTLDGKPYTVVGVMPRSFVFPFNSMNLWQPLDINPWAERRAMNGPLLVVGRLKPGQTREHAQTEFRTIMQRLEQEYPAANARKSAKVVSLRSQMLFTYDIFLIVFPALFLAVGFTLLIVCANIGNLLLARAAARTREIATRLALGATRARLVRQLLTESALLALLGGAAGAVAAYWVTRFMDQVMPGELYHVGAIEVDGMALLFASGVALGTALLFGLAPALQATRLNLTEALKEGTRGAGSVRSKRLQNALVVVQIALAMLLVAGATLMMQTFFALQAVDTGFNPDNLLTLEITMPRSKAASDTEENLYFEEVLRRIRSLPGVEKAAAVYPLPLNHEIMGDVFQIEGRAPASPEEKLFANTFWITTDYFRTMQIPLLRGHAFADSDTAQSLPVVILNRHMAERFWPGEVPTGQRIQIDETWWTVVGVVSDSVAFELNEETPDLVYRPQQQDSTRRRFVMVRAAGDPMSFVPVVRAEILAVDAQQPITEIRSMNQVITTSLGAWLMGIGGVSGLGLGALVLAGMGLYGVISYSVSQRTHEIGIRLALGAQPRDILKMVVGQGLLLVLVGVALGLAGAFALTRFLASLLFGVSAHDPFAFVATPLLLVAVALLACYIPARSATKVDPMVALRYE